MTMLMNVRLVGKRDRACDFCRAPKGRFVSLHLCLVNAQPCRSRAAADLSIYPPMRTNSAAFLCIDWEATDGYSSTV